MYKNSLGSPEAAGGAWKSGGQGRPPLQPVLENRVQVEKPPRCPFHAVWVDAHLVAKSRALRGCASKLACGRRIGPLKYCGFASDLHKTGQFRRADRVVRPYGVKWEIKTDSPENHHKTGVSGGSM